MIAIIVTQEIKDRNDLSAAVDSIYTQGDYPQKWWGTERIVGGYRNRTDLHEADGWRDVTQPTIGTNQKRGAIFFDEANNVFSYEVIDLTPEEIEPKKS